MKIIRNNEPMSSLTHFVGFGLAIAALVLMIVAAARYGNAWHVVAFSVFGASLVLLYLASTVYHIFPKNNRFKILFRRIDLSFIYILIAGTYTPILLIPLRGAWGWSLFGIVWGLALFGIIVQVFNLKLKAWQQILLYLIMGWIVLAALPILTKIISLNGFLWLLLGGVLYTIGVVFFILGHTMKKTYFFGMHEVFHLFVIAGSFSHFWLMYKFLVFVN